MLECDFEAALAIIKDGAGRGPIQRLIDVALSISRAPIVALVARSDNNTSILASNGIPELRLLTPLASWREIAIMKNGAVVFEDASKSEWQNHPIVKSLEIKWLAAVVLPLYLHGITVSIICLDPRSGGIERYDVADRLQKLASLAADEIQMLGVLGSKLGFGKATFHAAAATPASRDDSNRRSIEDEDHPAVVTDFLLSTLIERRRLLTRANTPYHGIMTWRRSIKSTQISALRSLKGNLSQNFVDRVCNVLCPTALQLFNSVPASIVAVPCGNSGPDCLSERLAQRLAIQMDRRWVRAFAPLPKTGGSHPKANMKRQKVELIEIPPGPVLLIDDVATSGAHIDEAASALRAAGVGVFSMVWIAA